MKKYYDSPEFELIRFSFEQILTEGGIVHSIEEDHKEDGDDSILD